MTSFKKTLAQRLLNITKISNYRISSSSSARSPIPTKPNIAPDPGDGGIFFRRFLHKRAVFQPELRPPPADNLLQRLREMDIARSRIRLDGLTPPEKEEMAVEDVRKVLRAAQLETVKSKLQKFPQSCVTYSEFVRMCGEICSDQNQAKSVAKMLDDSASVIIIGDVVFLKPEQVAKTIQALLPVAGGKVQEESVRKEVEEMEKEKAWIDNRANTMVRRELWAGLGFLMVQTAAFMRLTFWELSWDVMEPICFYVTSMYFMAGYTFFLRTSKEPSFEGFYQSRFSSKQKRLMKLHNFDIVRYNQLRAHAPLPPSSELDDSSIGLPFDPFHKTL